MNLAESLNNILMIITEKCTDNDDVIHFSPNNLEIFSEETDYLKERMGLSPFQSILFAVIITAYASGRCNINNVGKRLGMSYLRMLSFSKDLYALRELGLIRMRGNNDLGIPGEVLEAIKMDRKYEKPSIEGLNTRAIVRRISTFMRFLHDEESNMLQFVEDIDHLLEVNPETSYSVACGKYKLFSISLSVLDKTIFHILANLYIQRDCTVFDAGDIEEFIKDEDTMDSVRDLIDSNSLGLQIMGLVEPAKGEGLRDGNYFSLNEKVVKELFADVKTKRSNLKTVDLSDLKNRPFKSLFYNNEEQAQVQRLGNLLQEESRLKVFAAMKDKGLRTGLCCLFYGEPGTGKTETVYQLARSTGRGIFESDVARLRNCYVGETEKNVRALFHDYRIACEENEMMPILLFNEADAILGKRMEGAVKAVDRMENSVQNILLQEMENFEGIMIATTNLTGNLDPAFERRFLFKIRFNKPELEPRSLIWKSQFPSLSDDEAKTLAEEFSFSGGQIENVVRKFTIDSILSGEDCGYEQLCAFCREESVNKSSKNKIGFYVI